MSAKNLDKKGRIRNVVVSFRVSSAECKELDNRVKLCGYRTKQDYLLDSVLYQKVNANGNPLMFVKFRQHLDLIYEQLRSLQETSEVDDEIFTPLRTMIEILESISVKMQSN